VALVAVVAIASLAAGLVLSRFVVSPAELAAGAAPPAAGPITAPIEERVIENTITTRADVVYADAVDVKVDTTGLSGPAVVTGHVPEVGSTLVAGSVALEVAGRPLIVLPGDLPVYRSLHVGLAGPDVLQLKAALASLGLDPGDLSSNVFDETTAAALDGLYRNAGYPSPAAGPDVQQQVSAAREAERGAEVALDQARAALVAAAAGASHADRVEQDNAVRQAQRELDIALWRGVDQAEIDQLRDALSLAEARRDQLAAAPDVSAENAAVAAAEAQVADSQAALALAERNALTVLPAAEVLYLSALPRRVDNVAAVRGSVVQGAAMSVSGAELILAGTAAETDATLLKEGMPASFTLADGTPHKASVTAVSEKKPEQGSGSRAGASGDQAAGQKRYDVRLAPETLPADEIERLRGTNVRVSIPVESTDGAVLAVPVAALTAGPVGDSRVELVDAERRGGGGSGDGGAAITSLVTVITGLSAGGFVEVRSDDPRVKAGARVVVGR
jgi:hypothetical protein